MVNHDWLYVLLGMIVMCCAGLGHLFLTRLRDSLSLNYWVALKSCRS